MKKIVIIGAGISGLSAGCYMQMNGFETEIHELHNLPGGLCTSWEREGYNIDGCIHWLIGSKPGSQFNRMWNELIDMKQIQFVDFDIYNRFTSVDGKFIDIYTNPDKLEEELLKKAPEDSELILEFCNLIRKFKDFEPPADITMEISTFKEKLSLTVKMAKYMKDLSKYSKISSKDFAARAKNKLLRFTLENLFVPEMSVIFNIMTLVWFDRKDAGYPIGGSLYFSRQIEKKYLSLGGKIHYKSKVESIITENRGKTDIATGIITNKGEKHEADLIISAADGHFTQFNMLKGKYLTNKWKERFETFKTFSSYLQVSIGVKRKINPHVHSGVIQTDHYKVSEQERLDGFGYRIHDFDPTLSPEGRSLITTLIPVNDYEYWTSLRINDHKVYLAEKERISNWVIDILENQFKDIKNNIDMLDVSTPATVIRYTNNWKGSFEGWILSPQTGFAAFEKELPGLNNFYQIGQWIEPGGGLPTALMSGRNVTKIICKREEIPFSTDKSY